MKEFKKYGEGNKRGGFDRGGSRGGFGRPSFGGSDRDRPVTMHSAKCADCGKMCEVPFRPNGTKPVFCNDCFGDKRDDHGGAPARFEKRDVAPARSFDRPMREESRPDRSSADLKVQIDMLSAKLDKVMDLIKTMPSALRVESAPVAKVEKEKKPAKKAAVKKAVSKKK